MNKLLIAALTLALVTAPLAKDAIAGGVSICEIGVSTPTSATVLCATTASTVYAIEFSSNSSQVAAPTWATVYNTSVVAGTVDTAKIMVGNLDTNKINPMTPRNASAGVAVTRNNVAVPIMVLYSTP